MNRNERIGKMKKEIIISIIIVILIVVLNIITQKYTDSTMENFTEMLTRSEDRFSRKKRIKI